MKKLERLFYSFSFASFLFMTLSCSNLMNPAGINKDTDDTKLYTVTGRVEFSGAVPQEMADALLNNADNSNGAKNAFPVGLSYSRHVKYRNKNSVYWNDISLNNGTFVISLPAGDYELMAVVEANKTGEELFEILESDAYSLSIGAQNKKYNPVLTLKPVTEGHNGCINLKIKKTATYEYLIAKFDDNDEQNVKSLTIENDNYYYLNGDMIMNVVPNTLKYVSCGIHKLDLYFYNNNDQLVYYCHEIINVFNMQTTDAWSGGGHIYNRNSENRIEITPALVAEFAMSNVYVDEKSNVPAAVGTYQEPFHNLKDAIDYINRSAAAFDAAGGTGTAPDYTIWLKSDVTVPNTIVNQTAYTFSNTLPTSAVAKNLTIRSYGNGVKRNIKCSDCQGTVFGFCSGYYNFILQDLNFTDYNRAIYSDNSALTNTSTTIDNCIFGNVQSAGSLKCAVCICSDCPDEDNINILTLKGQTSFAEDAVIAINAKSNIIIDSSFNCQKTLCANIEVSQGMSDNSWKYNTSNGNVFIGDSIITLASGLYEADAKTLLSKFKVSNFWYDIKAVENVPAGCFEGKVIPHMHVSPAGGGNGTEKSPCTLEQAITNYNRFKTQDYVNLGTPITITLGAGEYNSWSVRETGALNCNYNGNTNDKINLTLEGAGKWDDTNKKGTKIKLYNVNENSSFAINFYNFNNNSTVPKLSLKNLTIDGNGQRFVNIPFYFVNADADFENVAIVNIKANSGIVSNHNPMILVSEGNLSIKNCDIKGCYIKKVNEAYPEGYDARRLLLSYLGKADKTFEISGKNRIEDNYLVDDLDSLTDKIPLNNIYLSTFNSSSVQSVLTVTGSLAGSSIGVVTETEPSVTEPVVFTSRYSDNNNIANLREIFKGNEFVVCPTDDNKEGQLILDGGELSQKPTYEKVKIGVSRRTIDLSAANPVKTITVTATDDGNAISARTFNLINLYSDDELVSSSDATVNLENGTINLSKLSAGVYTLEVEMIYKNHNYTALIDITIIKQDDLSNMTSAPVSGIYKIGTSESIAKLREWVRSDVDLSKVTFEMTNDIELPSDFTSIGSEAFPFKGTFDGKGYSLILTGVDSFCTSIFGKLQAMNMGTSQNPDYRYGIVKNLVVESKSTLSLNHEFYVIAKNIIRGKISNCINKCNIKTTTGGVTGFVEKLNSASIYNCKNEGTIISENGAAAGILIEMTDGCYAYNCFNTGNITGNGTASGDSYKECSAAGIAIYNFGYLINCLNYGNVTGKNITGGIAAKGMNPSSSNGIFNCCNVGIIKSIESSAGGIVGTDCDSNSNSQKLTIKNCVNYGNVSGKSSAFAIVGFRYEKLSTVFENLYYLKGTAEKGVYYLEDGNCDCTSFEKGTTEETVALGSLNDKSKVPSTIGAGSLLSFKLGPDGYPVFDE